ncbi:TolC family protein [Pedobacter sp. SYP-B3415]|uniref:TolC family protein n=1 Tax=Pedobacter sp. SYP-B3415 TaxID=2496641 RepID=UPI0013EBD74D|nr:TolC family protein [Pedobacter sp. SYP-B3415]
MYKRCYILISAILLCLTASAQERLSLAAAESLFQAKSLVLVAERYNIDIYRAQALQARLWENPYFSAEFNALNPEGKKLFDVGSQGQKAASIQQLILLGGKRSSQVNMANVSTAMSQLEFADVVRTLRFQLRTSFFAVYYDRLTVAAIDKQLANVDTLISSYERQVDKGNLPLRDLVRLQSLYLTLKNSRAELVDNIAEEQSKLNTLLATSEDIIPQPTDAESAIYRAVPALTLPELQELAIRNRPDVQLTEKGSEMAAWNLKYQRAQNVPDLTVGASYDQRSGAFSNEINITVGIPLPLWNRNRGNIKAAAIQRVQAETLQEAKALEVRNEVGLAYRKYREAQQNFELINSARTADADTVLNGVISNFRKANLSLIEFTDFMESYNQRLTEINRIRKSVASTAEEINYATTSNLFK